jgi:N-acetyl-alpha-D-glucosaminyl L-malate synthase BshA
MGIEAFGPGVRFVGLNGSDPNPASDRLEADCTSGDVRRMVQRIIPVAGDLDILHFHYAVPFATVTDEVRRRLGPRAPRLVGTLHGTDVTVFGRRALRRVQLARRLASLDAVTTVSRSYAALGARILGIPSPLVIPNFVDLDRFRPARDASRGRRPRLLHVSNFRPVKDPEMVARVFVRVRKEIDAELWLVGDGQAMRSVQQVVQAAGVDEDVRLFGLRRDVAPVVRGADLLLVTSRSESFCLAALEAAACAVPAVAGRVGGLPEVVADEETGLLYAPGDEGAATEAALLLLRDTERRHVMGVAARARAMRFSADAIVGRYEELYRRITVRPMALPVAEAAG